MSSVELFYITKGKASLLSTKSPLFISGLKFVFWVVLSLLFILSFNFFNSEVNMSNQTSSYYNYPSMGIGLNGISDWSTQLPFINHFNSSRSWIGHEPNDWGGYSWGGVPIEEFELDENGYPTSLPEVDGETAAAGTVLFTDMEEEAVAGGRYVVLYEGEGTLEYNVSGEKIESEPGRDIIEFTPEGKLLGINITETDPNETGDYIRDIRVIREDQLDLYEAGETFNPEWVNKIEDLESLRFMDWMETNNSDVSKWSERPTVDDATWTNGAPLEIMIELANQTDTDPWFNIPHQATDNYIRNFAQVVKEQLDPNLKAHFEFSNEVWNWQFDQAQYAHEKGQERWGDDVETAWVEWYGMRSAQMAQILDDVYGSEADDRLVKVISTQTAYEGIEKSILESPHWVEEGNPEPYTLFDAYAVTAYFGGDIGNQENYETISQWIEQDREGAFEKVFQELKDGSQADLKSSKSVEEIIDNLAYQSTVAANHDLDLVTYEAGTHVVATSGEAKNDEEFTDFLIELNRRPEMGDLYNELFQGWEEVGGTLFNHFVDVGRASKNGSWGALAHLNDSTPRWEAIKTFAEKWESYPDSTFDDTADDETNIAEENLLTYWNFNEGEGNIASDRSNENDGLLGEETRWVEGISGDGIGFKGEDSLIRGENDGNYLNGLDAITVSLWVNAEEAGNDNGIFSTLAPNSHDSHLGMRYDESGWFGGGEDVIKASINTSEGSTQIESSSDVQSSQWQHLALVWESGSSLQLYLDGEQNDLSYDQGAIGGEIAEVEQLVLGQSQRYSDVWEGAMDEFQIFNYALDNEEISQLANFSETDENLLTHWNFNEGEGNIASDRSNENDGLLGEETRWVEGISGDGIGFKGEDSLIRGENDGNYLNGLDAITVSLWVNAEEAGNDNGIFSTLAPNSHDSHLGMRYDESGWFGGGEDVIKASINTSEGSTQIESSSDVQSSQWQHLALVWESGSSLQLYLDGEQNDLSYDQGAIEGEIEAVEQLVLGQSQRYNDVWEGAMDQFQIFDRAFNSEEIAELANFNDSLVV